MCSSFKLTYFLLIKVLSFLTQVCDSTTQCADKSDEGSFCLKPGCDTLHCDQVCTLCTIYYSSCVFLLGSEYLLIWLICFRVAYTNQAGLPASADQASPLPRMGALARMRMSVNILGSAVSLVSIHLEVTIAHALMATLL